MIATWLKGRVSFTELMNMGIGTFHYLHTLVLNESRDKNASENKANEQAMDEIENAIT